MSNILRKKKNAKLKMSSYVPIVSRYSKPTVIGLSIQTQCLLSFTLGVLTFINTTRNGLVWDDRAALLYNKDVSGNTPIGSLFQHDFWGANIAARDSHKSYRPITVISFRINHWLYGFSPSSYHLFNCLCHAINCLLVTVCAHRISKFQRTAGYNHDAPVIAGVLFAVHPVHCDAVASIVGRADLLCTCFSLVAFLVYSGIECSTKAYWLKFSLALIFTTIATLCKELGMSAVGVFFAWEMVIFKINKNDMVAWEHCRQCMYRIFCGTIFCVCFMIVRLHLHGEHKLYSWTILENHISLLPWSFSKMLSYAHTHAWYLWKLIWPNSLCYDYGYNTIPAIENLQDSRNLLTFLAYIIVFAFVFKSLKPFNPEFFLGVSLGVFPFVPVSNILFPVGTIVAERLLYFPSVGFCILIALLFERAILWTGELTWFLKRPTNQIKVIQILYIFLMFVIAASLGKCFLRNAEWKSELTLFKSALSTSPNSIRVLNNYARMNLNKENVEEAILHLEKAVSIYPKYAIGHLNLGVAYIILEKPLHAIQHLQLVLDENPKNINAHGFLGQQLVRLWMNAEVKNKSTSSSYLTKGIDHLNFALKGGISLPTVIYSRGMAAYHTEDFHNAIKYFRMAIEKNYEIQNRGYDLTEMIDCAGCYNMLGLAFSQLGMSKESISIFISFFRLRLYPDNFELYNNAAVQYTKNSHFTEAIKVCKRAMNIWPKSAQLITNAGFASEKAGLLSDAEKLYSQAFSLEPNHSQIKANYHNFRQAYQNQ